MEVIRPGNTTLLKLAAGLPEPLLQGSVRVLNRAQRSGGRRLPKAWVPPHNPLIKKEFSTARSRARLRCDGKVVSRF